MKIIKDRKEEVNFYFHCKKCLSGNKFAFGYTKEGLQIICECCDTVVYDLDFEGQKVEV